MTEMTDADVFGAPKEMTDADVFGKPEAPTYGNVSESVPEAFLDRLRAGQALSRIIAAAGHEAKEGAAGQTPTGYSDERLAHMIDVGVFHDPLKSRGGPIQMANEAVLFPIAQAWQSITSGINAGIHGAGGAVGQIVEEFGGSQGTANRAKNEVINAGNWAMIEGGMGRFSRPAVEPGVGVTERAVGGLPVEADFVNAAKVLEPPKSGMIRFYHGTAYEDASGFSGKTFVTPHYNYARDYHGGPNNVLYTDLTKAEAKARGLFDEINDFPINGSIDDGAAILKPTTVEQNLRRMWREDGITPAEAVHDAQTDAFLRHEITAPQVEIPLQPRDPEAARLPEYFRSGPGAIKTTPLSGKSLFHETSAENAAAMLADDLTNSVDRIRSSNLFVADNPDIAIGQGGSGIRIEFDGGLVSGVEHAKPGTGDLAGREYQANAIGNNAIKSILVAPGEQLPLKPAWQARFDATFERKALADGSTLYERKAPEKPVLTAEEYEVLTETGGRPGSLSAAMTEPGDIPLDVQPAQPPGSLAASFKNAADTLFDIGRDAQMLVAPMARGTTDSMAIAKDFANAMRRNRWDWDRIDTDIAKRFTPEQRARMWNAADEESVSRQLGEPAAMREHQGLATLDPAERAAVDGLHTRAQNAWLRAGDVGLVEGEGLPAYTPRMVINTAGASSKEAALALNSIGGNLKTKTANMLQRKYLEAQDTEAAAKAKYGDQAALARDIRVLPMATAHLEDAIAGRTLINNIKEYGARTGADTVVEGAIPAGSETKWFTMDHPAFRTWRPRYEKDVAGNPVLDGNALKAMKDAEGQAIYEQVPIYIHGDFEGPLRAVLSQKSGAAYGAMMSLKGKTMSLIMNSPMIHNAVEWGRALPAMPGKVLTFKVYFEGNRAKHDVALMHEAIDNGLVPIGHRFFNQDISGLMEGPTIGPRETFTSKLVAAVPGLFDEGAAVKVKLAVDKAGDFWHNTLLWDRIADLQMGLYVNLRADAIAKGIDPATSSKLAAHWANRYAGALPKEAMSDAATKVSNMLMFSRSFTMGNLGVIKDMLTGLPKDVLAQIERDAGFRQGAINEAQTLPELPKGLSLKEMPNNVGNREYSLVDAEGKEHYRASINNGADEGFPGYHGISWIENKSREYSGVGPALYREIARSVEERGGKLLAGLSASEKAIKVHGELQKLGLAEPFDVNGLRPGLSAEIDAAEHMTGNRPNPMIVRSEPKPDAGFLEGSGKESSVADAVAYAKSLARRKAMSVVVADMALLYIGNSLMQNTMNVLVNDSTLNKELHGYAQRFLAKMQAVKEHPLELIQPLKLLEDLGATSENEPGKRERVGVGRASDGTSIYMRQPAGKIGEEFVGYMTGPLDMMRKKLGTIARPAWQIMSNDAGFGRKVYDPDADTPGKYLANLGLIAAHLAKSQFPEGQIGAFSDLVKGEGDAKVNALQALGPFGGVTFSKGAPGGPAVGEMYASRSQHEFKVNQALPDIRKQIQRGDIAGAMDRMTELDIPAGLQRFYVKTTLDPALRLSPRATRDFYLHSTQEQRDRFERALQAAP